MVWVMQPLDSLLADLTQFEAMLLNIEQMAWVQQNSQSSMMDKQQQMQDQAQQKQQQLMQQQPGVYGPQQQQGGNQSGKLNPGSAARGGQPPSPKALALPKFPIAGSAYSARKIAMMPVNQVTDVWRATGLPISSFIRAMDVQEPGILQHLTDELKTFFDQQLQEEQAKKKAQKLTPQMLNRWKKRINRKGPQAKHACE